MVLSIRPTYFTLVLALGVLSGCQTLQETRDMYAGKPTAKTSEDLLLAQEGQMKVVEDKREASPIEQHMKARGDVDPSQINRKNKFSKTVTSSHAKENSHYRVVRVEGEPEKTQTENYIDSILSRHKARQAGETTYVSVSANQRTAGGVKTTQVAMTPDVRVKGLRIGQHPEKTRIVLDLDAKPQFHTRFENGDRTLLVNLPKSAWQTVPDMMVEDKDLISSYRAETSGNGVELEIALKAPSRLVYQSVIGPSGNSGDRLVLDLVAR